MIRSARLILLVFALAAGTRARAGVLDGEWTYVVDLSAGFGSGTVTTAISETTAFGFFDGRLRLGVGPRLVIVFGGSGLPYTTAESALISAGKVYTFTVSDPRHLALNLAVSAAVRIVAGLELGANIDVVGAGFGPGRTGSYAGSAFAGPQGASPPGLNLLALGHGDRGTLSSEFYLAWWFDRFGVRAGASHLVTELETDEPLDDGNDRFRRSTTVFFVALGYRL